MKERLLLTIVALLLLLPAAARAQEVGQFQVTFDESAFDEPFTGTLFIAFAPEGGRGEPRQAMHGWFGAPPVLRFDLADVAPGQTVTLSSAGAAAHHPLEWNADTAGGRWSVQAVARKSLTHPKAGIGPGDALSNIETISYAPAADGSVALSLERVVAEEAFAETDRVKLFTLKSKALSDFHGFDYEMRAGVRLPAGWDPQNEYPVVYISTGFGGDHTSISGWDRRITADSPLDQALVVVVDASNRWGHSVFADSENTGPWGKALVEEFIPALEEKFGGMGPEGRFVTGVSSGGWASLWLQVEYPEAFAGCYSHVPDPIDFHDFQQINLYDAVENGKPRNMYVDEAGQPRPVARAGGRVLATYEDFVRREHVLNPGGQIRSFEAVFSPRGEGGEPVRIFDIETGEIDHGAADAWRKYDIVAKLQREWEENAEALAGKIHVYAGEVDTFYLEGAVERLQALVAEMGIEDQITVEVIPGMAHALYPGGQAELEAAVEQAAAAPAQ